MKINNFQSDLTSTLAEKEALVQSSDVLFSKLTKYVQYCQIVFTYQSYFFIVESNNFLVFN